MIELRNIATGKIKLFSEEQARRIMGLASKGWEYADPKLAPPKPEMVLLEVIATGKQKEFEPEHAKRLLAKKNSGFKLVVTKKKKSVKNTDAE